MALDTYIDLKTAIAAQCERSTDSAFVAKVPDFVKLAEGALNRELPAVETDATLTGTTSSRTIDISSLAIVEPVALFLAETGLDEVRLQPQQSGVLPQRVTSGRPTWWAIDGSSITFDCPLSGDYPFRFRYQQKLALATTDPNWLLTNFPDVYLTASMVWAYAYLEDWNNSAVYKSALANELLPSVRNSIGQSRRGTLRPDPALSAGRRGMSLTEWTAGGF